MGTLKVPGHVSGLLEELPHQDFPSFPGNTVHDVTPFCRKLLCLRETEMLAPKHTASLGRTEKLWSSSSGVSPKSHPSHHLPWSICV